MSATTGSISDEKARRGFWVFASLGALAAAIAWTWYGGAQFEAQSEEPKAVSAGTTMAGFAEVIGGVPLVIAHLLGLVTDQFSSAVDTLLGMRTRSTAAHASD